MKTTIGIFIAATVLIGCASESVTTGTKRLSREFVDKSLIKGKTTKAQVRIMLGEPQSQISTDVAGFQIESWSYTKTFYRDAAEKGFGYAIAYGMAHPYGSGYDRVEVSILTISFDKSGRVSGHTFATSGAGMPR